MTYQVALIARDGAVLASDQRETLQSKQGVGYASNIWVFRRGKTCANCNWQDCSAWSSRAGGSRKTRLQLFSSTKPCNADTRLETLTGPCWLPVRARGFTSGHSDSRIANGAFPTIWRRNSRSAQ